ncbi:hypothetical protein BS47DRAFT_1370545 [Hydnum rufescens UP504]|uniref:Phospholipase A-2-activating protein n=1 Tax=Hydnum rufescens UP504 TaxID=1448309 RepID=A0A9P6E1W9_9AGAM|nr:hypothetical protein BS47DRAFT_1370545 [Hydnum rufescens UP504]
MVFKLSATLIGHTQDVRAVASPSPSLVLSASRDTKAIAWTRSDTGSSVYSFESHLMQAQGYLVAGGQDTLINVFSIGGSEPPTHVLLGHSENVCALDATPSGTIISGSWDKTARVWKKFDSKYVLKGHTQAVWAVLAVDDEQYLTGSADKTIKHWIQHKCVRDFTGHTDAVRGLALVPDIGFVSCSNDSEIRVWTLEGDTIHVLSGHTSFVYSVALLPSGEIVSGGEDRSVRVWKDGECSQVIVHPAISVWAVSAMPNGDIVSGSSDGVIRVFSEHDERWADAEDLKKYDELVSSQALPSQQVGDVKKSDLPGPEGLSQPGKKEGQVLMIRNASGAVEAHQWSTQSSSWQKIGEVVDAVGSGRRQLYQGKEYDYVFDVDIQDGVPPLKLPYNISENPYEAAKRFLDANELPTSYIDEVVRFIEKNTAGAQLGGPSTQFVDPYTGASSYRSSPSTVPTSGGTSYQDPFTGSSGYHGAGAAPPSSVGSALVDPFTGASAYRSSPSVPAPTSQSSEQPLTPAAVSILPVRIPLSFKQANIPAMRAKLTDINAAIINEPASTSLALDREEQAAMDRAFAVITETSTDRLPRKSAELAATDVNTALRVAPRWPKEIRFPVLDLARLISAYAPLSVTSASSGMAFVQTLLLSSGWSDTPWPTPVPKYTETNILLALRGIANLYQVKADGSVVGLGDWNKFCLKLFEELLKPALTPLVKNQWVALGTIVLKYILTTEGADSEGQYRALVALGNVVYASKLNKPLDFDVGKLRQAGELSLRVASRNSEERFRVVVGEISRLASTAY